MFQLAHLSDLHIGPLPSGRLRDYAGKRLLGRLYWQYHRSAVHDPAVAQALIDDIAAHQPDHVAVTGDLINLALPREFALAAEWLAAIGPPDQVTLVPGNHDAYVHVPWARGAGQWADYMAGDMRLPGAPYGAALDTPFPFVRQRRNVALIGLCSGVAQAWGRAGGRLGRQQRADLAAILRHLGERGYFRVVLIHHPPLPGLAAPGKALDDAAALRDILESAGAELVLHGHNHRLMRFRFGAGEVHGVPSASAGGDAAHEAAAWTLYRVERRGKLWRASSLVRQWDGASGRMRSLREEDVATGRAA